MSNQDQNSTRFGNRNFSREEKYIILTQAMQATIREEARRALQDRTNPPRIVGGKIVYD